MCWLGVRLKVNKFVKLSFKLHQHVKHDMVQASVAATQQKLGSLSESLNHHAASCFVFK